MARKSDRQLVADLVAEFEPALRRAFIESVYGIRSNATIKVVAEKLERGDVAGAMDALGIDAHAYGPLDQAIADAYYGAGKATVGNWPLVRDPDGARVVFRFGTRNNEAEAWLRGHSSALITRIVVDQREAVREALTTGLSEGRNPRSTALDIVGRVSRATGRREGGIVGLTVAQARYVASARAELLSGDPEALAHYLTRQRRDRRFDRAVAKAVREERPLDAATVAKVTGRYSDRLLKLRGDMIGHTETMVSIAKARDDAIAQQIMAGKLDARDVTKVWKHLPGQENPRLYHRAMNGKSVPYGEQFVLPNGVRMDYPHAPDAPAGETIFCKCVMTYKIAFIAALERRHRVSAA